MCACITSQRIKNLISRSCYRCVYGTQALHRSKIEKMNTHKKNEHRHCAYIQCTHAKKYVNMYMRMFSAFIHSDDIAAERFYQ